MTDRRRTVDKAIEEKWQYKGMGDHQLATLPHSWDAAPASAGSSEQQLAAARRQPAVVWQQPVAAASSSKQQRRASAGSSSWQQRAAAASESEQQQRAAAGSSSEQQLAAASLRVQVISDGLPRQTRTGRQMTPTRPLRRQRPTVIVRRIWRMRRRGNSGEGGIINRPSSLVAGTTPQHQPVATSSS